MKHSIFRLFIISLMLTSILLGNSNQLILSPKTIFRDNSDDNKKIQYISNHRFTNDWGITRLDFNNLKKNNSIEIPLLNLGTSYNKHKIKKKNNNNYTWVGFNKNNGNYIILVCENNIICGVAYTNGNKYRIIPLNNGTHIIQKLERDFDYFNCLTIANDTSNESLVLENTVLSGPQRAPLTSTLEYIDVVIAYTSSADDSSIYSMEVTAEIAIEEANLSYVNSDINIELNLAHLYQTNFDESTVSAGDIVDVFAANNDNNGDDIFDIRQAYTADVCVLWVSKEDYGGEAREIGASSGTAFCSMDISHAIGKYTFAHEIGHLQGARHQYPDDPYQGYEHGYVSNKKTWFTIMCIDVYDEDPERKNFWSNPSKTYNNENCGVVDESDNARKLNNTKPTVADFKEPIVSGGVNQSQTWRREVQLSGLCYIAYPTVCLRIENNTIVDLNGNAIRIFAGTIDIGDSVAFSENIILYNNGNVKGIFPSIPEALNIATEGETIEVSGSYNLTSDLTIGSGITFNVKTGSELKFASGKYLEVESGGTLTANGATFSSTSGTWGGVKYYSSSLGSLTNCTISNATCGIYLNAGRSITNCTISTDGSYNYGIYINSNSPNIIGCNITGSNFVNTTNVSYGIYNYNGTSGTSLIGNTISATYGIYNYNSSPYIKNNNVTSEMVGLYCESSSPYLAEYADHGHNYFHGDYSECGIWATSNSHPVLGTQDCGWGENKFNYNTIDIALAYAETGSSIYAKYNWWGSSNPNSSLFMGNVTYIPYLTSEPTFSSIGLTPENDLYDTRMMLASSGIDSSSTEDGSLDFTQYYNDQWDLDKKIGFLRYLYMLGEGKGVADLCEDIIEENPYQQEAFTALDLIYQISKNDKIKKDYDKDMLKTYLKTFKNSKSNQLLKANAMLMLAGIEKDVTLMDEVYSENKDTYMGKHALRKKFMHYFYEEENLGNARTVLNEMDEVYPDEAVTYESHVLMGDKVMDPKEFYSQYHKKNSPESIQSMPTDIAEILPEEYALNAAYPNPFNPSMTLEYALPTQSDVKCSIYNVSGSLVKEYSFSQNAGTYSIVWNASNVSSGIYLIRFTAEAEDGSESFVDYQKVTLLK